ncbi:MAG TPA: NAD(+)/NADH kinase [Frankiaceae bacterium]|nr:NAD(+)/NADH kinase [Frankiaceae bacterium]
MTIRRIGLVVHGGKPAAKKAAEVVRRWAAEHDVGTADVDVWEDLDGRPRRSASEEAEGAGNPDVIVSIGGDGTFLRAMRVAAVLNAQVLGVDIGRVGFLTEVTVDDLTDALDAVHEGRIEEEQRLALTMRASRPLDVPAEMDAMLRYGRGPKLPPPQLRPGDPEDVGWGVPLDITAINDVVFEKLSRDRQASLGVYVNGRLFASYSADAVMVSTPTGSTAYSFAAGGPVVSPRLDAIIFTPVAPHMVFDRTLVLNSDESVAIRVLEHSGQVVVSVDGQLRGVLDPNDWVAVYAAQERARLVRLRPSDFLGRLRDRFGLSDAAAAAADGEAPMVYRPDAPVPADLRNLYLPPAE